MGKGVSWHNTQFYDLKNTRENPSRPLEARHERQKESSTLAIPTLTPAGASTISTLLSRRDDITTLFRAALNRLATAPAETAPGLWIRGLPPTLSFSRGSPPKEIQSFFQRAADFLIGRVGKENIVSAVVHMDEKTPHLHLVFVPLTEDNHLCAKEIIGNRANLTKWQDDFHAYMVEKYSDLERGESANKSRKHIPPRLFKQAVNLSKQARAIEATLDDITPFNAGKKKEEALSLLKKWFPQMENFFGQLKKYKVTINDF